MDKVAPDVFDNNIRIAFVRFCINVEALFMLLIAEDFALFKRRTDFALYCVEQSSVNSMKKAVKQGTVMKKEIPKVFINGEDAVAMGNIDKFKGHRSSTLHSIEISTGGCGSGTEQISTFHRKGSRT